MKRSPSAPPSEPLAAPADDPSDPPARAPAWPGPFAPPVRTHATSVVGRSAELTAMRQEIEGARSGRLAALTLEGEPGIGKTRLLTAAATMAAEAGFTTVAVTADEELRGPFLLARWLLGDVRRKGPAAAEAALDRALDGVSGRDDPATATLAPEQKLLRAFDLAAVAIQGVASSTPLAVLIDDLQWADGDSIRLLRYLVRTLVDVPVLLLLALRPEELAASETAALLADMERLGIVRRLQVGRMTQTESSGLLQAVLGGRVDAPSAATVHAQAEGVPFILEAVASAYQAAGLFQQIDGVWTLGRNVARLVPSSVRTLIQRRAARLPPETRTVLAEAAVVGRSFRLDDLLAVCQRSDPLQKASSATEIADLLAPAVRAGLLAELPEADPADYTFVHGQVREFAAETLTPARRRELHRTLVELLTSGADPVPESLALVAAHALAAGDTERATRFAIDAAQAALGVRAPEEALRLVGRTLPTASSPADRVALLIARDEALEMLRRPAERLEGLAELGALAEALDDAHLELDTMLRRAGALRMAEELDGAAELATRVRQTASARGDRHAELSACLELGQARLGRPLGESYSPSPNDADLDAAQEAFERAQDLAGELGDQPALAATTRELGVILNARIRAWYIDLIREEGFAPLVARLAEGELLDDVIAQLEVAPLITRATGLFERAIELFDQLGDRRGVMSSVIAMAYMRFGPDIHLQGSAKRIEEIRHLSGQLLALTRASERAQAEAQMLYGVHVFAAAKGVADLAIDRGVEAFERAHLLGEHTLEFLAAGGTAMVQLELHGTEEAARWLERATAAATAAPTPFKARQLALWRGRLAAAVGDIEGMSVSLSRAVGLAEEQGRPAAVCEALAQLALEAARIGAALGDEALLDTGARAAEEVIGIAATLPGHPLWCARAAAAQVRVALARNEVEDAVASARTAFLALRAADVEDLHPEIRVPIALGLLAGGTEQERRDVREEVRLGMVLVAQRILDEDVRARWFRGPVARELSALVDLGPPADPRRATDSGISDEDAVLVRLLVEGWTNRQMAGELGLTEQQLVRRLAEFYARTGTGSRAQVTTFAFRERVI